MVTCCPVIVASPAVVFPAPLTLVESSYLNFISLPAAVFTVSVFVFESTSVSSPVAVAAACDCPSAPDEGPGADGVDGDGACCEGGAPCAAGPSCCASGVRTPMANTNASDARPMNTPWVRCMVASCPWTWQPPYQRSATRGLRSVRGNSEYQRGFARDSSVERASPCG